MAGTPFTNPDWAEETTEQIDRLVGVVRDRVTNNIITVVRTIVFGLLGALLGIAIAVIGLILATRGLQVLIALAVSEERAVYISYLLLGAILVVGGSAAMRRRSGTPVRSSSSDRAPPDSRPPSTRPGPRSPRS